MSEKKRYAIEATVTYPSEANYGYREAIQKRAIQRELHPVEMDEYPVKQTWTEWIGLFLLGLGLADMMWKSKRYRWEFLTIGVGARMAFGNKVKKNLAHVRRYF